MSKQQLEALAQQLGELAFSHNFFIATAESCTGGGLSEVITRVSGSSQWFDRGFVTYTNEAKVDMLDVQVDTLELYGAVSEQVAEQMVSGAIKHSRADVAVSITGIAGPTGGTEEKPVGTVCFGWTDRTGNILSTKTQFDGDRQSIRQQSCLMAMQGLIDMLEKITE